MKANVQNAINIMKQMQWVLQWDKKSIVIRNQAKKIMKFVRTFSALGDAIAQIDPIQLISMLPMNEHPPILASIQSNPTIINLKI